MNHTILAGLDEERRAAGEAAERGRVVRERSPDGAECRIVYSACPEGEIGDVIRAEMSLARAAGYTLEWKVYGHDEPPDLGRRLAAEGFEPDDRESVLVLAVDEAALAGFGASGCEIRRVVDQRGLADYADIARDIGRHDVEEERRRLAQVLRDAPRRMSVHIAYVDGEPAACGRVHFREGSRYAELAGGRTRTAYRRRGLFTALVGARLREARERGCTHVFVDALPTSEPTLRKRGFQFVTHTQPFMFEPGPR
ncbi:GNAT family N-acetyltransferase [Microbispora sp. NPDC049125]|uniref:GNAT family N-acetyltransferase n=1 Tax=Microbispora sp. NPDC049125 TaxID=3154929 RepID=UPI0034678058